MRHFVIFFTGKEGTSPLLNLLDNFSQVSIIRLEEACSAGLEPFDRHHCGPMSDRNLRRSLEMVLGRDGFELEELNRIYLKTSISGPIGAVRPDTSIGFKMRLRYPKDSRMRIPGFSALNECLEEWRRMSFLRAAERILKKTGAVAFFAIRQDLLRWSLSKYHGDGTCRPGNLQFRLAGGEIGRDDIGRIQVDCRRLGEIIAGSSQMLSRKLRLIEDFRSSGIDAHPLFYEDFLEDKIAYFRRLFRILEIDITDQDIAEALEKGAYFEKVHSSDISDFVVNHEEVLDRFSEYQHLQ